MTDTDTVNMVRTLVVTIEGVSPYTQGQMIAEPVQDNETRDQHDERCWKLRAHWNREGYAVIPAAALHKALHAAAKYRNEKIPGEGKKTYSKRFGAGVFLNGSPVLQPEITKDTVEKLTIFVPSDGRAGGSTRVPRRFPIFTDWRATFEVTIADKFISDDVFERHLFTAGQFIGIGTHRPSSSSPGPNGRFRIVDIFTKQD